LIEALATSGRYAVIDEVTTRLMPHSFPSLVQAEKYVDLLMTYQETGYDPEAAAAAVGSVSLEDLLLSYDDPAVNQLDDSSEETDDPDPSTHGWATVAPEHARVGGPVTEWMTTYPHRRATSPTDLAEHMDRLSKHGHSFGLIAFSHGLIMEIARMERAGDERTAVPQASRS